MTAIASRTWHVVCSHDALMPERGVCVLVEDVQVAVFRAFDDELFAIANIDPFSGAAVLSRGIVGTRGDLPTVSSPLHKQVFDLRSGHCLDDPSVVVDVHGVRRRGDSVEICLRTGR